jgi:GTP cyclohydrolase IA
MMMRGIEKQHSSAVTSSMLGCFRERRGNKRTEFLSLIRQPNYELPRRNMAAVGIS